MTPPSIIMLTFRFQQVWWLGVILMIQRNHGNRAEGKILVTCLHFAPLHKESLVTSFARTHGTTRGQYRAKNVYLGSLGGGQWGVVADLRRCPSLSTCVDGCFYTRMWWQLLVLRLGKCQQRSYKKKSGRTASIWPNWLSYQTHSLHCSAAVSALFCINK